MGTSSSSDRWLFWSLDNGDQFVQRPMAVLVGAVRDHQERRSVIMGAPHIAKRPRHRVVKAGAILSDTGFRNRLENPLRVAGEVDDFIHLAMELQVEGFISRANGGCQLG